MQTSRRVELRYAINPVHEDWVLSEEPVPESSLHDLASDLLKHLLLAWAARTSRNIKVGRNLAMYWDKAHPTVGVAPDVYAVEPPPPEGVEVTSLRLWEEGHSPPLLAVEVVSATRPQKDYFSSPERYAASGTGELWVFDPKLVGPKMHGGPFRIQVWSRDDSGRFTRIYAGEGPVFSPAVGGHLFVVDEGRMLRIADDEAGTQWWMTGEEAERAAKEEALRSLKAERTAKEAERVEKEAERAAKEAERVAKEEALRRIADLEAQLASSKPPQR